MNATFCYKMKEFEAQKASLEKKQKYRRNFAENCNFINTLKMKSFCFKADLELQMKDVE